MTVAQTKAARRKLKHDPRYRKLIKHLDLDKAVAKSKGKKK